MNLRAHGAAGCGANVLLCNKMTVRLTYLLQTQPYSVLPLVELAAKPEFHYPRCDVCRHTLKTAQGVVTRATKQSPN